MERNDHFDQESENREGSLSPQELWGGGDGLEEPLGATGVFSQQSTPRKVQSGPPDSTADQRPLHKLEEFGLADSFAKKPNETFFEPEPPKLPDGLVEPVVHRIVFDAPKMNGTPPNAAAAAAPNGPEINPGFTQLLRMLTDKPAMAQQQPEPAVGSVVGPTASNETLHGSSSQKVPEKDLRDTGFTSLLQSLATQVTQAKDPIIDAQSAGRFGSHAGSEEPHIPPKIKQAAGNSDGFTALLRGVPANGREPANIPNFSGATIYPLEEPDHSSAGPSDGPGELTQLFSGQAKPAGSIDHEHRLGSQSSANPSLADLPVQSFTEFLSKPQNASEKFSNSEPAANPGIPLGGLRSAETSKPSGSTSEDFSATQNFGVTEPSRYTTESFSALQDDISPLQAHTAASSNANASTSSRSNNWGMTQLLRSLDSPSSQEKRLGKGTEWPSEQRELETSLMRGTEILPCDGRAANMPIWSNAAGSDPGATSLMDIHAGTTSRSSHGDAVRVDPEPGESEVTRILNASRLREMQRGSQIAGSESQPEQAASGSAVPGWGVGSARAAISGMHPSGIPTQASQVGQMAQTPGPLGQAAPPPLPLGHASGFSGQNAGLPPLHMGAPPQIKPPELKPPAAAMGKLQQMLPILLICVIFLLIENLITKNKLLKH